MGADSAVDEAHNEVEESLVQELHEGISPLDTLALSLAMLVENAHLKLSAR